MRRALVAAAAAAAAAVAVAAALQGGQGPPDGELAGVFSITGVYNEVDGLAEIAYEDSTGGTRSAVLEVLGMSESFQKTYESSAFELAVPFAKVPKYGWQAHPITLVVDHEKYGTVNIKTEIRAAGEPAAPVIFGVG